MRRRSRAGSTKPRRRKTPAARRHRRVETIRGVISSASKEEALRESEHKLHQIIDTLPSFLWSADPTGEPTYVNQRALDYSGMRFEEFKHGGWEALIHPADFPGTMKAFGHAIETGTSYETVHRLRRSDGEYRWHQARGEPLRDRDGRIIQWYGLAVDIDDAKSAEDRLRRSEAYLAEAQRLSNTGSWGINPATRKILYWSEECYRIWGFDLAQGLPYRASVFQRIHPDDRGRVLDEVEGALRQKRDYTIEFRIVLPDGTVKYLEAICHHVFSEEGELVQLVGTNADVTERKHAEQALRESERKYRQLIESVPCHFWSANANGEPTYVNQRLLDYFGIRFEDQKRDMTVLHPDDVAETERALNHAFQTGESFQRVHRLRRADGEYRWHRVRAEPLGDHSGNVIQWYGFSIDIDEGKNAEDALRRSETYLVEAQRLTHTATAAYDATKILYFSDEAFRLFGLDPLQGLPSREAVWQRIHPDDVDTVNEKIERALRERRSFQNEFRLKLPDGTVKHVDADILPVFSATGELVEIIATAVDVTERKRAEDTLRRGEAWLAQAQRLSHTGTWVLDGTTRRFLYWSDESYRIWGFDPLQGLPTRDDMWGRIHPDDRERLWNEVQEALREQRDFFEEFRILLPDGTVKYLEANTHHEFSPLGALLEVICTNVDVTDRKRAGETVRRGEAWLAQAQTLIHTGTWVMDGTTRRYLYWSDESYRIWGFDPLKGLPNREDVWGRIHPDDRERVRGEVQEALREKRDFLAEFRISLPDGAVKYLEINAHHEFSPLGELIEVICTNVDVTERKRAQDEHERLRQLEADLAHLNRVSTMGELAASLSHEILHPIATARNNARAGMRFLEMKPPNLDEAREAFACVVRDADRAKDIIGRMRDHIKKAPPRRDCFGFNEAVSEVIAMVGSAIAKSGISVSTCLMDGLALVQGDRVQLQQVLVNLILNAVEAMSSVEDGTRELSIRTEQSQTGGILVAVHDSGPGVDPVNLERVFEPFYTTKTSGIGMGLSICQAIIHGHGGRLSMRANEPGGAVFQFTLPAAKEDS
jgi:PAS domain S-box-containing protein